MRTLEPWIAKTVAVNHDKDLAAARYLKSIRNPHKRTYGVKYWEWLTKGAEFPNYHDSLSYMAAQAVRQRLVDIKAGVQS